MERRRCKALVSFPVPQADVQDLYNLYTSRACASQAHAQVELYRCAPGGRGAPRWISRNIKPNVLLAAEIFKL